MNETSYCAVKHENVGDRNAAVLRSLSSQSTKDDINALSMTARPSSTDDDHWMMMMARLQPMTHVPAKNGGKNMPLMPKATPTAIMVLVLLLFSHHGKHYF